MQPALVFDLALSPTQDTYPRQPTTLAISPGSSAQPPSFLRLNPAYAPLEAAPPLDSDAEGFPPTSPARGFFYYLADAASDVFSPLALRQSGRFVRPRFSFMLCAGLTAFLIWAAYFAVPGLPQSMPLNTTKGGAYMALLIPASIMASCLALSLGRLLGRFVGFIATACRRRDATEIATNYTQNSPTLSEIVDKA